MTELMLRDETADPREIGWLCRRIESAAYRHADELFPAAVSYDGRVYIECEYGVVKVQVRRSATTSPQIWETHGQLRRRLREAARRDGQKVSGCALIAVTAPSEKELIPFRSRRVDGLYFWAEATNPAEELESLAGEICDLIFSKWIGVFDRPELLIEDHIEMQLRRDGPGEYWLREYTNWSNCNCRYIHDDQLRGELEQLLERYRLMGRMLFRIGLPTAHARAAILARTKRRSTQP